MLMCIFHVQTIDTWQVTHSQWSFRTKEVSQNISVVREDGIFFVFFKKKDQHLPF